MSEKAKIRRGAQPRHKRPVTQPPRRGGQAARPAKPAATPAVAAAPLRRFGRWAIGLGLAAALVGGLVAVKVPQMLGLAAGEALGAAGLTVRRVEITGLDRMDRLTVYAAALDQRTMAMPLVDLGAIRERLLRHGWIADARVSRRLPDTLLIDIVERRPAAVWQHRGRLTLIDGRGVPLAPVGLDRMPDLPLLIGAGANLRAPQLARLIAAAPSLKPIWAGATWVGGRRWDMLFQSGETLALPEGEAEAEAAIAKFARMDKTASLLGRGFVRFDMRDPDKFYVRTTAEPGRQAAPNQPVVPATPVRPPAATAPATLPPPPPGARAAPDAV